MKSIIDFFKVIIRYDKMLVTILFGDILFGALQPFPKIVLSKIIFDYLVKGGSLQQFLYIISVLVVSDVIIQYIFHIFEQQFFPPDCLLFRSKTPSEYLLYSIVRRSNC